MILYPSLAATPGHLPPPNSNTPSSNHPPTHSGTFTLITSPIFPQIMLQLIQALYFNHLPHLWKCIPPININSSYHSIKTHLYKFLWSHFDSHNPCTFYLQCPCTNVFHSLVPQIFNPLFSGSQQLLLLCPQSPHSS